MTFRFLQHSHHNEEKPSGDIITIVSGLPRSGTSMMMKMLEVGGLSILTDKIRAADESNPNGYYEYEAVKRMREGHVGWMGEARGKAVKIVSSLLEYLPPEYEYQVVFMQRNMAEILASQRKMLILRGETNDKVRDQLLAELYQKHLTHITNWLSQQSNMRVIYLNYNQIVEEPHPQVQRLNQFLHPGLDEKKMLSVVESSLYRHRNIP